MRVEPPHEPGTVWVPPAQMSADDPAAAYDAWYETPLGAAAHRIELALIGDAARPQPGERVLDAGCGTGIYTAWLSGLGLNATGLDRDPAMLAAAHKKVPTAKKAPTARLVLAGQLRAQAQRHLPPLAGLGRTGMRSGVPEAQGLYDPTRAKVGQRLAAGGVPGKKKTPPIAGLSRNSSGKTRTCNPPVNSSPSDEIRG